MTTMSWRFEQLLTSKTAGFDLPASPLQRAIARAADGLPIDDALDDDAVERHFGCDRSAIGLSAPVLVVAICGVRSGKSLMAACAAVRSVLAADLRSLRKHEVARFAIVAPTVDNADATFRLLLGGVQASAALSRLIVGTPTADTLTLRRQDGRGVEIVVVAAHRGAVTLRSRWLAGFVLDEVALFGTESTGAVVNAEELLRAGETRLVPGAQGWLISSPFGPSGLLHDQYRAHWGQPGRVLVVHAPTHAMNPAFPIEQIEELRRTKPDVAAREYDAQWVDADSAFIESPTIDAAVRKAPLEEPRQPRSVYSAAMDAATRGNSWTLVIGRTDPGQDGLPRVVISLARQWTGSKTSPLDPDQVLQEIAHICARYGVYEVAGDQWSSDALRALARRHDLTVRDPAMTPLQKARAFDAVRTMLATGHLELPPHPVLLQDLRALRKVALANAWRIDLPKTADGRHCDFAPSVALLVESAPRAQIAADTPCPPPVMMSGGILGDGGYGGGLFGGGEDITPGDAYGGPPRPAMQWCNAMEAINQAGEPAGGTQHLADLANKLGGFNGPRRG
jgi:hypothetical protein